MSAALWYREKLPSRCLPAHSTKQRFSDSLNGQHWRFLKSSLDDFRNGFPPPCDNTIIRSPKGHSPILLQKSYSTLFCIFSESCQPKVVKIRYGAWYLDPKTWKKQNVSEPLMDLKETGNSVHHFTPPPVKKAP
ncbi:LOW QUALITY PROTEIN: protein FAM47E [Morus bassanus]